MWDHQPDKAEEYQQIQTLLRELDRPTKSALIEVLVAEVRRDSLQSLGMLWDFNRFGLGSAAVGTAAFGSSGLALAFTDSEVMAAQADGLQFLKFFPATAAGGIPMLKALGGPFPDVVFCPTGGITPETAPQFLALSNVLVCGGSWLTPADAVAAGDWDRITQLARAATALRA